MRVGGPLYAVFNDTEVILKNVLFKLSFSFLDKYVSETLRFFPFLQNRVLLMDFQ
jgi:hypothetical protein